jgi:hypothetical protein
MTSCLPSGNKLGYGELADVERKVEKRLTLISSSTLRGET